MTTITTNTNPTEDTDIKHPSLPNPAKLMSGSEWGILLTVLALLAVWVGAIAIWGYPALIVVALSLVAVMYAVLLILTVGK